MSYLNNRLSITCETSPVFKLQQFNTKFKLLVRLSNFYLELNKNITLVDATY
jgi:hypothetical protein